jgi:hypothetical protein
VSRECCRAGLATPRVGARDAGGDAPQWDRPLGASSPAGAIPAPPSAHATPRGGR